MVIIRCLLACDEQTDRNAQRGHWHCPHCKHFCYIQPGLLAHLQKHVTGELAADLPRGPELQILPEGPKLDKEQQNEQRDTGATDQGKEDLVIWLHCSVITGYNLTK